MTWISFKIPNCFYSKAGFKTHQARTMIFLALTGSVAQVIFQAGDTAQPHHTPEILNTLATTISLQLMSAELAISSFSSFLISPYLTLSIGLPWLRCLAVTFPPSLPLAPPIPGWSGASVSLKPLRHAECQHFSHCCLSTTFVELLFSSFLLQFFP